MSYYPANFPLHAPLAMFNGLVEGNRESPASNLAKILESELHRHHMHLAAPAVVQCLRHFFLAFFISLHMADAYRFELRIRQSYLFADQDQMTLFCVRQRQTVPNELEIRPFIFKTNPNIPVRKRISTRALNKVRDMLNADNLGRLYDQLIKAPIGVVEVSRPNTAPYSFWNAYGNEVVWGDSGVGASKIRKAPFKVYAYLTAFRTTSRAFCTNSPLTLAPSEIPDIIAADFVPGVPTPNQIRCVEVLFAFLQHQQMRDMFELMSDNNDLFLRFLAGFTVGVKHKYHLAVSSRVRSLRPHVMHDITFLVMDNPRHLPYHYSGVSSTLSPVTVNFDAPGTGIMPIPEDIQMLTTAEHFYRERIHYPPATAGNNGFKCDSSEHFSEPLRFDVTSMLRREQLLDAHTKLERLVFEALKRSLRQYGPNTIKQTLLAMCLGQVHVENRRVDMRYAVYDGVIYSEQVMTVVFKLDSFGYVLNIIDLPKAEVVGFRGDDVQVDHALLYEMNIGRFAVLNVEMLPVLNSRKPPSEENWKRVPADFLHSLDPNGYFPGMVYRSRHEQRIDVRSRPSRPMRLERFMPLTDTHGDPPGFLTKTYLDQTVFSLLSGTSVQLCPVHNEHQALALFQTALAKYAELAIVPSDKSITILTKPILEEVRGGNGGEPERRTRPITIFHRLAFTDSQEERPAERAIRAFRREVELRFPQLQHLTTALTMVRVEENESSLDVSFCQLP